MWKVYSLMQMAKTSGAIAKHSVKDFYLTVNTPQQVFTASFASLGDVIIAEPMGYWLCWARVTNTMTEIA